MDTEFWKSILCILVFVMLAGLGLAFKAFLIISFFSWLFGA